MVDEKCLSTELRQRLALTNQTRAQWSVRPCSISEYRRVYNKPSLSHPGLGAATMTSQQSIRASCDRCRAKKLGCTISTAETSQTGVQQCMRCARAKVDCIFSRRAPTRRKSSDTRRDSAQVCIISKSLRTSEAGGLPTEMDAPSSLGSSELLSGFSVDWPMWSSPWSEDIPGVHREQNDADLLDVNDHIASINTSSLFNHGKDFTPPQHNLIDLPPLAPTAEDVSRYPKSPQRSLESYAFQASSDLCNNMPCITEGSSGLFLPTEHNNIPDVVQLSGLVAEFHEALITLSGGHTSPNKASALDTYPMGPVLKLARRFMALLRSFWAAKSTSVSVNDDSHYDKTAPSSSSLFPTSPINHTDHSNSQTRDQQTIPECFNKNNITSPVTSTGVNDVPTMLLVLTCYASLLKLYMMVFSQIESSIEQLPDPTYSNCNTPALVQGGKEDDRGLRLRELFSSPTNETCSRLYIAVQMVLDELQAVDDLVCCSTSLPIFKTSQSHYGDNNDLQGKEGHQRQEVDLRNPWVWFTHQLEMVKTVLNKDARRVFGIDDQNSSNGLFQQGHRLKALLRGRMNV